jgi:hypothetical protein
LRPPRGRLPVALSGLSASPPTLMAANGVFATLASRQLA